MVDKNERFNVSVDTAAPSSGRILGDLCEPIYVYFRFNFGLIFSLILGTPAVITCAGPPLPSIGRILGR